MTHQTFAFKEKPTYQKMNALSDDISSNTLSHDHSEGAGGTGQKLSASGLEEETNPTTRDYDMHAPFVVSGLLPATSASLSSNISAGEGYAPDDAGDRLVRVVQSSAQSKTYTANRDTYVYLHPYPSMHGGDAGYFHFEEVANGASEPTNPDSSLKLAMVRTNGSAITLVNDLRSTSPLKIGDVDNLIYHSIFRQALINSGFDIWQRGTTFTPNDDVYIADHWNALVETNGSWTFALDSSAPSGVGVSQSIKATNVTLNNQCAIVQFWESPEAKKLAGQTVSLSFYAKTNGTEIANLRATLLAWTGTADVITSDVIGTWASDGTDPTFAANWTKEASGVNKGLTSSWQKFTMEGIVLDTVGLNNLALVIWVDDGTIAANDDFYVTAVQLNVGPVALPYMPKSYQDELFDCQRYYYRINAEQAFARLAGSGQVITTTTADFTIILPQPMRTTPVWSNNGTVGDYAVTQANGTVTALNGMTLNTANNTSKFGTTIAVGVASAVLVSGNSTQLFSNNNTNAYLAADAEL